MKKFIKKYCYISIPTATSIVIAIIYFSKIICFSGILTNDDATLIQISGTLIGFLLTAMTIFLSLPKDTQLMHRIKKYEHHKIFSRCVSIGLVILTIDIFLWLIKIPSEFIIFVFLLGLEETLMAAYYIYKLCIYNFE
mgnify:FL=1|jgi:hypothetical protein